MLYIKINLIDKKFELGKKITKLYPYYTDEFIKYMAKILRDLYKTAISKQRYIRTWAPLSLAYVQYKKLHHLKMGCWQATGLLRKSIVYRKRNGYYLIGIDPYKTYKGGIKVLDVARCLEYGTSKIPPRPLFRPVLDYVRKNIGRYWKKFLNDKKGIHI